jgi:VanZ family protein
MTSLFSMLNKYSIRVGIAIFYLVIISVIFFLPGSAFPQESWFDKVYLDKWIHAGIFFTLAFIWLWALRHPSNKILIFLVLYGLSVEIIQGLFISNRSFDLFDLLSDTIGAIAGILLSRGYIKK